MTHEKFHYRTQEELEARAAELGLHIPLAADTHVLAEPVSFAGRTVPNRLGIAPMEGADSLPDGRPSQLTYRRYTRYAESGASVVWFEAISLVPEGRSSRTQLYISKENLDDYKRLVETAKEAGLKKNGYEPFTVMQANHSGRYSNPDNHPAPIIAERMPWLEQFRAADDSCIVTDDYLDALVEKFGEGARLAKEAGFDAVDVKSSHGYLFQEMIGARLRPGKYGGSYENRTRLLKDSIAAAKREETDTFLVTSRIGIYDGYVYPYGFGVSEECPDAPDLAEPIRLLKELRDDHGLSMVCLTMGNPYATTHVTRPYDAGMYVPPEHPLEGIARMCAGIGQVKAAVPEMTIFASAPSYLRRYADLYTAGCVEEGLCDGMLFGRLSFADPDFANEILKTGRLDPKRVCLTCGKCGDLIRSHKPTGCVVRDSEVFVPFYKDYLEGRDSLPENFRG